MDKRLKKYIILWLSQSVSGLGSSITGFSLVLWAYGQSHSAMSISLMSFFHYVPYIFCSLFVGGFIDRHKKKTIMLLSDSIAAAGSLIVFICLLQGNLCSPYYNWHYKCVPAASVSSSNRQACPKGKNFKCKWDEFF